MEYIMNMAKAENASDVLFGLAKCAGKLAPFIRDCLVAKDHASIVDAWVRLEVDGDKKAIAKLRTNLNREGKKLYGHGLTVKDGEVVTAANRSRTTNEEDSKLVALAKIVEANADDDMKATVIELMESIVATINKDKGEA